MNVEEVSLSFLGGYPIPYFGLVPVEPRSSFAFFSLDSLRFSVLELYLFHSRDNFLTFPDPFEIEDLKG